VKTLTKRGDIVTEKANPATFPEWRTEASARAEDAAYTFGHHLVQHCRDEVLAALRKEGPAEGHSAAEDAIDTALHNVVALLEGFWRLQSGPSHTVEYSLQVRVRDASGVVVETQEISPCKLDLPIGYWKWARDHEFR
jgi:hypothetical protein